MSVHRATQGGPSGERINTVVLAKLSDALNRALSFDEKTRFRLIELGHCSVAFKLRGGEIGIVANVRDGNIALAPTSQQRPDVQIEGGVADFIAMAKTQRDGSTLAAGKVEIQGDLATAQSIQRIIAQASIDWEELLAMRFGDVFAHQLGRGLRGGFSWLGRTRQALERDIGEYFLYEARMLPTERELEAFIQSGTELAASVERLNARIAWLQRGRDGN